MDFFKNFWYLKLVNVGGADIAVSNIALGIIFIVIGFYLAKIISRRLSNRIINRVLQDNTLLNPVTTFLFYILLAMFTLFALSIANIPISIFAFLGGALAIGFGFGSQNIVNNFISGIIVMFERPFKIGDFIEVDGQLGQVEEIGFRSTHILIPGNKNMLVPNSKFLENSVINWTLQDQFVRTKISVGVAYGTDTELVKKALLEAVLMEKDIATNPPPTVSFNDFGDNALLFSVSFTVNLYILGEVGTVSSNARFHIDNVFKKYKISMPFPQRDIHLQTIKPLELTVLNQKQ